MVLLELKGAVCDFTDPVAAVNSVTDASEANPYLVLIGPGVYTLTQPLNMKPYVTIAGSGQDVTILTGAISSDAYSSSTIVSGADNATLSDLTIDNTGGANFSISLYNNGSSPIIHNVTATTTGGIRNFSVLNTLSSPTMKNVRTTASGGTWAIGVYNSSSTTNLTNVIANVSGASNNYGVNVENSSPFMTNVTAYASGSVGVKYGVRNIGATSHPAIRHSMIAAEGSGTFKGIKVESGTVRVMHSTIIGGVEFPADAMTCFYSDNGFDGYFDFACVELPLL